MTSTKMAKPNNFLASCIYFGLLATDLKDIIKDFAHNRLSNHTFNYEILVLILSKNILYYHVIYFFQTFKIKCFFLYLHYDVVYHSVASFLVRNSFSYVLTIVCVSNLIGAVVQF